MPARRWSFALPVVAVALTMIALAWQRQVTARLRAEVAARREQSGERRRLEAEHRKLMAAQPTEAELADTLARLSVAEQLRARLAILQRREGTMTPADPARSPAAVSSVPSLYGNTIAAEAWRNAGVATPEAAFQTALWAAAGGDLDVLADTMVFDAAGRSQAAATFDRLPAAVQNQLGTPERLFALLTATEVPLGNATIFGWAKYGDAIRLAVRLADVDGSVKTTGFILRADDSRWRLVVPAGVVQKYSAWLQGGGGR